MRSLITLGVVSLVGVVAMVACGDDDSGSTNNTAGTGGARAGAGGTAGSAGTGGSTGGTAGTASGGTAGTAGTAPLPAVPASNCTGCVQLTVSNNSATLVTGATQNQAGYIFVAAQTDDPWDLSDVSSITWRVQALTPNAAYFVQPFLQTTPPEDTAYGGVFPPGIALAPAQFAVGTWVDIVVDVAAIGVVPVGDAGADAGDASVVQVVDNVLDAGPDAGDAGVVLTGFDKRYTRFVGLNVGAQPGAPLGWVSVEVDSVTVNGTTTFPNKTFTAGIEGLTLNQYQVPVGTLAPAPH